MSSQPRLLVRILLTVLFVIAAAPYSYAAKRIGVIMTGDIPYYQEIHETFVSELNSQYTGKDEIEIILQRPFPNTISWSNAARKLIAHDVDLIVTYGSPATQAVIKEKTDIPLIYVGLYEPEQVALNIENATGCGFKVPLSSILRYFKRLKPINTINVVFSSIEEDTERQYETIRAITEKQNIKAQKIDILSKSDLEKLKTVKSDAVFITGSSLAHLWLEDIIAILSDELVPAAGIFPDTDEAGVMVTLYQPSHYQGETAAEMAGEILLGKKPAELKAHIFQDTELVFNLVEAKRIGINFPIQLLIEATRVIQ